MLLDATRWPGANALIERALERPLPEREAYVRRAAAHHASLAEAVLAVLAESTTGDAFLAPAGALGGALFSDWSSALGGELPVSSDAAPLPPTAIATGTRFGRAVARRPAACVPRQPRWRHPPAPA